MRALILRPLIWLPALLAVAAGVWLWGFGGAEQVASEAARGQRDVQNAMAGALRRLQGGDWAALSALWGLCFAYGFFHAAGPGHGKLVIGGYGVARRVPMGRLAGLAVSSSLAQAATAVVLVYAGVLLLGWSRERMQMLADTSLNALSMLLIAGIGLVLLTRGTRRLWRHWPVEKEPDAGLFPAPALASGPQMGGSGGGALQMTDLHALGRSVHFDHAPTAGADICETCGHAHGPTLEQAEAVRSLRDGLAIIAAIAVRPCTGALFLLILTRHIGIDWAGIMGAFVMALGTATITVLVAVASVSFRESALMQMAGGAATARAMSVFEALAGGLILALSVQLIARSI
ncbi:MAG: hypothetical protein JJT81_04570 [Rubellimicrobium sp.]|nr:hypothetical protein [Rubellimicrobium sp.]